LKLDIIFLIDKTTKAKVIFAYYKSPDIVIVMLIF